MNTKRKISVRKVLLTLFTAVMATVCVIVMLSASRIQDRKKIKGVSIVIDHEDMCRFVSKEEIEQTLFANKHLNLGSLATASADLHRMEKVLQANPWVEQAEVHIDNSKTLNIRVTQRIPMARLFFKKGSSFYMDSALHLLPVPDNYTHYELPFIGLPDLGDDSLGMCYKRKILQLARLIKQDTFWQAQVSSVVMNSLREIEIVPVLGSHKILLGSADKPKEQLENVFAFYKKVMNKVGWDRYTIIDARFENQIAASPALQWKAPVDRALSNMNWVKTIVDEQPAENNEITAATKNADTTNKQTIN